MSDIICKICSRQVAKYTCPSCNAPYCSLTCFRSPGHGECSEGFYKKEIAADGATAQAEDRLKMMEMLKRLAEAPNDDFDDDEESEDDDNRFGDVDLDDSDALWERLTPEERTRFMASPFATLKVSPWWDAADAKESPPLITLPTSLNPSPTPGIVCNLFAVTLSYAYVCRHLAIQLLAGNQETPALLSRLIPFLVEPQATLVFSSIEEVMTSLTSKAVPASALLGDAIVLLRPHVVMEDGKHPHDHALRMLSDIYDSFASKLKVQRKLIWYAACVRACTGRQSILGRLVEKIVERQTEESKRLEELQVSASKLNIL